MVDSEILLLKYWLEVSPEEQTRRLEPHQRPAQGLEALGHGPEVLQPLVRLLPRQGRHARRHRHLLAPWYLARTDDRKRGRLDLISHLLGQVPYKPLVQRDITLPKRQRARGYTEPELPLRYIPTLF
jgi:hypothetical protein